MSGLIGGALKKSMKSNNMDMSGLSMFFIVAIILVVKTYLVKVCYNEVVPKIMKDENVYRLTFVDSLFLVILFSNLF